ncbi:serine/threonine-protein kinase [Geodermatophilus nigrescens]|uniref:non-specific serine/threonine protein kinase n=1 Tax=Geodermatophilus nigrescens TaxID=1070870 RepID=A0A1M5FW12_9ACTN|nr:serine/threonine-protein kinase [Geodermatophilus nigrescens]SHF95725.1 Serine/threonine protein kinase [Geodermatophilus nigrescens]
MSAEAGTGRLVAGRYTVTEVIGRGGMGVVWRATDEVLGRPVALKEVVFPTHLSDDEREALRSRTLREARTAARLLHPNVTTLYDVVEEDGRPWLVMEHVDARSLQEVVQRSGPLPWPTVARIGLDVLEALEAAHAAGIVHRDVKPANVLVGADCAAHLTDFGIATATGNPSITTSGAILGSPAYMSPERARGEEPGPAVDLWSLGATLYTAVEGRLAFDRPEPMATLFAVVHEDPEPPRLAGPLGPVLEGLLTRDVAERWDVARTRTALRRAAEEAGPQQAWSPPAADGPPRGDAPSLGGQVERFDVDDLRALASVIGTVARDARDQARHLADKRRERRAEKQARAAAPPPSRPAPPRPAPPPPPVAAPPRPAARRRRFKRRWVVVPVVLAVLAVLAALGGAVALLAAAFGVW